jgi:hypothetical protein
MTDVLKDQARRWARVHGRLRPRSISRGGKGKSSKPSKRGAREGGTAPREHWARESRPLPGSGDADAERHGGERSARARFILDILSQLSDPVRQPTSPDEGGGGGDAGFVRDWLDARGIEAIWKKPHLAVPTCRVAVRTRVWHSSSARTRHGGHGRHDDPSLRATGRRARAGRGALMRAGPVPPQPSHSGTRSRPRSRARGGPEYASLGADDLFAAAADGCISRGRARGALITAHKGLRGSSAPERRAAHGSRWDLGSAIARMGRTWPRSTTPGRSPRGPTPLIGPARASLPKIDGWGFRPTPPPARSP